MSQVITSRRALLKGSALTLAAAGLAGVLPVGQARAEDTLARLKEQGYARVAIANEPPWTAVNSDGTVTGAAPEVARAVMAKLGVPELVATVSEYGAMIPGLQAGRFDVVTAGLFIKPERCAAVIFSQPDLCDAEAFAVKKGNPTGVTTYEALAAHASAKVGAPAAARKNAWHWRPACRATG